MMAMSLIYRATISTSVIAPHRIAASAPGRYVRHYMYVVAVIIMT